MSCNIPVLHRISSSSHLDSAAHNGKLLAMASIAICRIRSAYASVNDEVIQSLAQYCMTAAWTRYFGASSLKKKNSTSASLIRELF